MTIIVKKQLSQPFKCWIVHRMKVFERGIILQDPRQSYVHLPTSVGDCHAQVIIDIKQKND